MSNLFSIYLKSNYLSFLLLLIWASTSTTVTASHFSPFSVAANVNCDDYEGTLLFSYENPNDTTNFTTEFILTDTNNIILQISTDTSFANVSEGSYFIYILLYRKFTSVQGKAIGNNITAISGDCFDTALGLSVTICKNPHKIIRGLVFEDSNQDGIANDTTDNLAGIGVQIFEDINQNGLLDTTDTPLAYVLTDSTGEFNFLLNDSLFGSVITHVVMATDTSTIPPNYYYTTDNVETAVFLTNNGVDTDNNFGLSKSTVIENEVWLDLNANGLRDSLEVSIANMPICIITVTPLLIDGILYPPNTVLDTAYTDANGIYVFNTIPNGSWQLVLHYDQTIYVPTYDADGIPLDTTNFMLTEGIVAPASNPWCTELNCIERLDFGLRLNGELSISGNICIDDGTKDGNCGTGNEEMLSRMVVNLFTEAGDKLGGMLSNDDGAYAFSFLPASVYIVDLTKGEITDDKYFFTTQVDDTPAAKIANARFSIFQKVVVNEDIFGLDFAFFPFARLSILARDDVFSSCPGGGIENNVASNDSVTSNLYSYERLTQTQFGGLVMASNGDFNYEPFSFNCVIDQFEYRVCDLIADRCDTATVTLEFQDKTPPTLTNLPTDITLTCDEQLPNLGSISTFDNCPAIGINVREINTQTEDGCGLFEYAIARTWEATDNCGNTNTHTQTIEIIDQEAPNIHRIYTLPNGKKLVAGIARMTSDRWKTVSLPIDFQATPLIFCQIVSDNEATPAIVQMRNVSPFQFELRLQEVAIGDRKHLHEQVAWIAMETGVQVEDYSFVADFVELNNQEKTLTFPIDFAAPPLLFLQSQTTDELDLVLPQYKNLTESGAILTLQKENSTDREMVYPPKKIAYLGIENIGDVKNDREEIIGETGRVIISNGSSKIRLKHKYYNPIILASSDNSSENTPTVIRVHEVQDSSFEVRITDWAAFNPSLSTTPISYVVIEGSIPLYPDYCQTGADDLTIGTDLVAIDNCDNSIELTYSEFARFNGLEQIIDRKWSAIDQCGNPTQYVQRVSCEGIGVQLQTYLQGALVASQEEGLMRDDLRRRNLIPTREPYTELPKFQHYGSGGGETLDTTLLQVMGKSAIVDWVFIELRDELDSDKIVATSAALLQRNGNIISATGDSIIVFTNVAYGNYSIAVRHRNHIALSTLRPYVFAVNSIPSIDFRDIFTPINGNEPTIKVGNRSAQWAGDLNGDGKTVYQGPNNDPFAMFLKVVLDEKNINNLTNYITVGYNTMDFDLDGQVIYQGPNNDRAKLLINTILNHPDNPSFLANFVITGAEAAKENVKFKITNLKSKSTDNQ
ncbi:MAG: SdrD B-like domain-containing protein [Bacteroidota bacterium]